MPSIIERLGDRKVNAKKAKRSKKYKPFTITNKDIARSVSVVANIPYEQARKIVEIIIKLLRDALFSNKILYIKGFGRWKVSQLKQPYDRAAYRMVKFQQSYRFNKILGNVIKHKDYDHQLHLVRKILRLLLTGIPKDRIYALKIRRRLERYLSENEPARLFLLSHNYWPPSRWRYNEHLSVKYKQYLDKIK